MTELNFSAIGDASEDVQAFADILEVFQKESGVVTHLTRLPWDRAWSSLLMHAMEAKGADVSQVGTTWASTLAALDSLRPFSETEVRSLGGPLVFAPAAWQTVRMEGRGEVWAIPWSVYTFVVFYRRDLLKVAGVDEATAFSSPAIMWHTFASLQKKDMIPWAIPTKSPYLDIAHIASSWARAYGGELISPDGKRSMFNTPQARQGLVEFFELYRYISPEYRGLDYEASLEQFFQGKTAVLVAGAESYSDAMMANAISEDIREKIGVASVPGISWIGGDHLVIWKTIRTDPEKERAGVELIRSLTSVENQVRIQRETTILPARLDAYSQLEFQPEGMRAILENILQTARPHPTIRLWHRIESMLVEMLGNIANTVVRFPDQNVKEIVETKLDDYEKRFAIMLGG